MDKCKIFNRIREIIADNTGISKDKITKEINLQSDLGLSSLQIFVLLAFIEDDLEINIDTDDLESVVNMDDFIDLIVVHVKNKNG